MIVTFPNRRSPLNIMHRSVVAALRAGRTGLGCVGVEVRPQESRLTFRRDIPNRAFALDEVDAVARESGLGLDSVVYHSLHFPFSIPGLRGVRRTWDRFTRRMCERRTLETWGREVVVRFLRSR